jgi:steroid 5-alpha reductase family enzyme
MLLSANTIALICLAAGVSLVMMAATAVQLLTGKSGWIDTLWTFAVGAGGIAATVLPVEGANDMRRLAVGVLVAIWALRLGLHIAARTHESEDDPRYAALKAEHPKDWPFYLFWMLQAQAIAAFILVMAVRFAALNPAPFPAVTDLIGILILLIAFTGEALADAQLRAFGKAHKKAVANTGLWRWSRHPNYFFEWLGWCGWAVIALSGPFGWLALLAPLQMYVLLVHVSGIPPLEKHMRETRGQAFDDYAARTSAFFLLPPKEKP